MTSRTIPGRVRVIAVSLSLGAATALGYCAQPQLGPAAVPAHSLGLIARVERLERENEWLRQELEARRVTYNQDRKSVLFDNDWNSPTTDALRVRKDDLIRVSVDFDAQTYGSYWAVSPSPDGLVTAVSQQIKCTQPLRRHGWLPQTNTVLFRANMGGNVKFGIRVYKQELPPTGVDIWGLTIIAENLGKG